MRILSISMAHDAGVCLYENGKILYFFKEERLTRKKRDRDPLMSLNKVLKLNDKKIDVVVFCPVMKGENFKPFALTLEKHGHNLAEMKSYVLENDHHLQHASLAFFNSGFDKASVIVVDRNGSELYEGARESETIFEASKQEGFSELYKSFWIYHNFAQEPVYQWGRANNVEVDARSFFGIVKVYESVTTLIGERALENGKVMGLSAYGNKEKKYPNFFVNETNIPNDFYFSHESLNGTYQSCFLDFKNEIKKEFSKKNYQEYADLAWQVQAQTQNALIFLVKKALKKSDTKNIVLTGGYALNVVANQLLIKTFPDVSFYFEPMADDSGNAIGGALLAYFNETGGSNIKPIENLFFHGTKHSLEHLGGQNFSVKDFAKNIFENKAIAIYNEMAEAGPRSLGNRSIIFNAMNPNSKEIINLIKKREWYRPFALSVLESDAENYFEMMGLKESPYMTVSFEARDYAKDLFPGVVHVDNSCRIQTVGEGDGILFSVLQEIKKISGHGVVLNTSFNLAGEPLVETPEDALRVLDNTSLDAVWFPEIKRAVMKNKV